LLQLKITVCSWYLASGWEWQAVVEGRVLDARLIGICLVADDSSAKEK